MYVLNILFASNLKFLSYIYLSGELQSNVGCFNVGLSCLGPLLVGSLLTQEILLAAAAAMVCTTAFWPPPLPVQWLVL